MYKVLEGSVVLFYTFLYLWRSWVSLYRSQAKAEKRLSCCHSDWKFQAGMTRSKCSKMRSILTNTIWLQLVLLSGITYSRFKKWIGNLHALDSVGRVSDHQTMSEQVNANLVSILLI
jgi:hypothetical protein